MLRIALIAAAFAATPALAANYVASLGAPAPAAKLISSERMWTCAGDSCAAGGEATSPAKRICSRLAKEVGALTGFTAQGKVFTADELAACNTAAAPAATIPLAAR